MNLFTIDLAGFPINILVNAVCLELIDYIAYLCTFDVCASLHKRKTVPIYTAEAPILIHAATVFESAIPPAAITGTLTTFKI